MTNRDYRTVTARMNTQRARNMPPPPPPVPVFYYYRDGKLTPTEHVTLVEPIPRSLTTTLLDLTIDEDKPIVIQKGPVVVIE